MKQLILALSVLVLLAAATGLFMALRAGGVLGALAGDQDEVSVIHSGTRALPGEPLAPTSGGAPRGRELPASTGTAASPTWDPSLTVWVAGTVRLPAQLPADENASVVAFRATHETGPLGDGTDVDVQVLAQAPVDAVGRFRLGLPPDLAVTHLAVRGRYLYSAETLAVQVAAGEDVELSPELGAWIEGVVSGPPESPDPTSALAGLTVDVLVDSTDSRNQMDGSAWARRSCDADSDGRFSLGGVATARNVRVMAVPAAYSAATSESLALHPGQHLEVALQMAEGARIRGLVVDDEGDPIPAAVVVAVRDANFAAGRAGRRVREVTSDAEGRFDLPGVEPGAVSLRAEVPGRLFVSKRVEVRAGELLEDVELRATLGGRIEGKVTWPGGRPAEGVAINAFFDMSQLGGMAGLNAIRGVFAESRSDAEGRFIVTGLGKGPFIVQASGVDPSREGQDSDPSLSAVDEDPLQDRRHTYKARAVGVSPGTVGLTLELEQPRAIVGRVVDHGGAPVEVFVVRATSTSRGLVEGFGTEVFTERFESPDGSFELAGMRAGDWSVVAAAEGYGSSTPLSLTLPVPEDAVPLVLQLPRAASVRGRVLAPDGTPFEGASVGGRLAAMQRLASTFNGASGPQCVTDGQGAFLLDGLTPGAVTLAAEAEGFAASTPLALELAEGEALEDVVFSLRRGARVTGEVYDAKGERAVDEAIVAQMPGTLEFLQTVSDGEGAFVFETLPPGNWNIVALPNEDRMAELLQGSDSGVGALWAGLRMRAVEVSEGEEAHVVLGEPPANPVRVHGRVTLAGTPVSGVVITFAGQAKDERASFQYESTDTEGRYEVLLAEAGDYLLVVHDVGPFIPESTVELRESIPDRDEFELDVELPQGLISGRVRGADGEPAGGVRVRMVPDTRVPHGMFWGGYACERETEPDGTFAIRWVPPGTYALTVGGAPFGGAFNKDSRWARQRRGGLRVAEGEHLDGIDFRLETGGSLEGVVRDPAGVPIADTAVFVFDAEGRALDRLTWIRTDAGGRYRYGSVGPGEYTVSARVGERVSEDHPPVSVRSGATVVDLVLDAGTMLEVVTIDEAGAIAPASLRVIDGGGRERAGTYSFNELMSAMAEGRIARTMQSVGPLPPGRYEVHAETEDGRQGTKRVTLRGQERKKITLRLKR